MELTEQMRSWITDALDQTDRRALGPIEVTRARPWALVCQVETTGGRTWAKMPHPSFGYEGRLALALDGLAPDTVHVPLVVGDQGWMLAADGGATYTDHLDGEASLKIYRRIQAASASDLDALLTAGTPDRRPESLGAVWSALTDATEARELRDHLSEATGRFQRAVDVLADDGRVAVCNTDVRPSHAFVGPPIRLFDWGDATVSHPLCCLGIVLNFTRDAAAQHRLIESHWPAEPRELVRAAGIVESVLRADVWRRDPPGARDLYPGMVDFWMTDALNQVKA